MHDGHGRAGYGMVKGADGSHGVKLSAETVDGLARQRRIRIHKGKELHVPSAKIPNVRLAAVATVRGDQGLVGGEALQLPKGVLYGDDIGNVSGLLGKGDGLLVLHGIQRQQLDRIPSVMLLVEATPGFQLVRGIQGYRGGVVGDDRLRGQPGGACQEIALDGSSLVPKDLNKSPQTSSLTPKA